MRGAVLMMVVLGCSSAAVAAEPSFQKAGGGEVTEGPYRFELDKFSINYDGVAIWGRAISNSNDRTVRNVNVVFTAYDEQDKFLGRSIADVQVDTARGSQVGFVNQASMECEGKFPARVEWQITPPQPTFDDVEVVAGKEKTSKDTPLVFQLQKISTGYSGISVFGRIGNGTDEPYEDVMVIVTAYGEDGKFLGRGRTSASPSTVGPGQVGYIDGLGIDIGNSRPVKMEWKVITGGY